MVVERAVDTVMGRVQRVGGCPPLQGREPQVLGEVRLGAAGALPHKGLWIL